MAKQLMKGNGPSAKPPSGRLPLFLRLPYYPQNEVPEYMSRGFPKWAASFSRQSEVAAINMVYGAAAPES